MQQSDRLAYEWYLKAAENGMALAQKNVGLCYWNGEGVRRDEDKAIMWWQRAARQGNEKAQEYLEEEGYGW